MMDILQPSLTHADVRQSLQNTQITLKSHYSQLEKIKTGISSLLLAHQADLQGASRAQASVDKPPSRDVGRLASDAELLRIVQDRDQTISALRTQLEQLRQSQAPLAAKMQQLEADLTQTRAGATLLQSLLDEQKNGYESLISELEARLLAQSPVSSSASGDTQQRMQARIAELETQLSQKELAMQNDRNQFSQLLADAEERAREQQKDLLESKDTLQRSLSEYQRDLHQLREKSLEEVSQLRTQLARAEAAAAAAVAAPSHVEPALDSTLLEKERQERVALEQQLKSTEAQLVQATAKLRKLEVSQKVQQNREAEHTEGGVLAQQVRDLQADLKKHVLREQELMKEKSDLETELEELKTICDEKTTNEKKAVTQAEEWRVRVEVLEAQLTRREQELTKLHWDLDGLRSQLNDEQSIAHVVARTQPGDSLRPATTAIVPAPSSPAQAPVNTSFNIADDDELIRSEADALQRELAKIEQEMNRISGGSSKP